MANISFGGGTDPSSTFAYLNRQYLQEIEALAVRSERRSDERRAAEDSDMYDKYKNGLISDDQWLAYVARRVEETKGDPEKHQQWVETQREFSTAISDQRAEARFEAGEVSIHGLIDHYERRMADVEKSSPEYRELQGRLFQLSDKMAEDDLWYGAQDITDRIATGKASLKDLVNFYKGKLRGLRGNSDIRRMVEREIRQIESRIATEGFSLSGSGSGGGRRSSGGRSSGSSGRAPTSEEAVRIATSGSIVDGNKYNLGRDTWGVSREAREFPGILPGLSANNTIDVFDADASLSEFVLRRFAAGEDAVLPDGTVVSNTPENARQFWFNFADSNELKARAQEAKGDQSAANNTRLDRINVRDAVVYPMRALRAEEYANSVISDFVRDYGNVDAGDLDAISLVAARHAPRIEQALRDTNTAPGAEVNMYVEEGQKRRGTSTLRRPLPEYERSGPETVSKLAELDAAFKSLQSGDPNAARTGAEILSRNGVPPEVAELMHADIVSSAQIRSGEATLGWVLDQNGRGQFTAVRAVDEPNKMWRTVYMDVAGTIKPVAIQFTREAIQHPAYSGLVNADGSAISNLADLTPPALQQGYEDGLYIKAPVTRAWQAVTPTGQNLYWLAGLGPDGGFTTDITKVLARADTPLGVANAEDLPLQRFANAHAVGTAYLGENPDAFVRLAREGEIIVSDLYRVNHLGARDGDRLDSTLSKYNLRNGKTSSWARSMAWDDPEEVNTRVNAERADYFARYDQRIAEDLRGVMQDKFDSSAGRTGDPFGDSTMGRWMAGGPLGDIFGRDRALNDEEQFHQAFGQGIQSKNSDWGFGLVAGIANAIGVRFGQPEAKPAPKKLTAQLPRPQTRLAADGNRLTRFALPTAPRTTPANTANRITLPVARTPAPVVRAPAPAPKATGGYPLRTPYKAAPTPTYVHRSDKTGPALR